ncbi:MAG: hypothetical protein U1F14_06580 [Steroidobacteraceae bacterium]
MQDDRDPRLRVALCWRLHQPEGRDLLSGEPLLPAHALGSLRECLDLAVHLETAPGVSATVALSPVLLEQLREIGVQIASHLRHGTTLKDPLLALLTPEGLPECPDARHGLLRDLLSTVPGQLDARFAPYAELAEIGRLLVSPAAIGYASPQFLRDFAVWHHLEQVGESLRRGDPRVQELEWRARGFESRHQRLLLEVLADAVGGLVPRYRRLVGSGRIELATAPWGDPVLPLMLDFSVAREAQPGLALPSHAGYPGGEGRVGWHLARAAQEYSAAFGVRPRGLAPADAAISVATLDVVQAFGVDWLLSSEPVLRRSLAEAESSDTVTDRVHHPHRLAGRSVPVFFADERLSRLLAEACTRPGGAAGAAAVVHALEWLAMSSSDPANRVVTVVADVDAAFEGSAAAAWEFLGELHARLSDHPRIVTVTPSQCLAAGIEIKALRTLVAGSEMSGSLSSWIGDVARNRAWDLLCGAKILFDQCVVEGSLTDEEQRLAERQLAVCESADWPLTIGDGDPRRARLALAAFERHLVNLYQILGEAPPEALGCVVSSDVV